MKQMLSVLVKEQEDTLVRLTGLCYRRGYHIESLSVTSDQESGCMTVNAVLACGADESERLCRHVAKLVDVVWSEVTEVGDVPAETSRCQSFVA